MMPAFSKYDSPVRTLTLPIRVSPIIEFEPNRPLPMRELAHPQGADSANEGSCGRVKVDSVVKTLTRAEMGCNYTRRRVSYT